jgi:hypothetical protein
MKHFGIWETILFQQNSVTFLTLKEIPLILKLVAIVQKELRNLGRNMTVSGANHSILSTRARLAKLVSHYIITISSN